MIESGVRAVFLDRDGVLNELVERDGQPASPRTLAEFALVESAVVDVARLRAAGFQVFVVTNQPDVVRGRMERTEMEGMLAHVSDRLDVQEVRACLHDDADDCTCRKPKDGMLRELAQRWHVDLSRSFMVGDTWRDMQAGRSAQCTTILVGNENADDADMHAASLSEAVDLILGDSQ